MKRSSKRRRQQAAELDKRPKRLKLHKLPDHLFTAECHTPDGIRLRSLERGANYTVIDKELYCHVQYSGDPEHVFRHAVTYLRDKTPGGDAAIQLERVRVQEWVMRTSQSVAEGGLPIPMSTLIPIPPDRIGVHWQLIKLNTP